MLLVFEEGKEEYHVFQMCYLLEPYTVTDPIRLVNYLGQCLQYIENLLKKEFLSVLSFCYNNKYCFKKNLLLKLRWKLFYYCSDVESISVASVV